ncbi:DUF1254 domain-containing protein [Flammeovirga agarivorans]|uniref:DUF1254 domain-containing protein n=1 Tax=Flammeovirga agarivorans TaxID=2726742 RepID=A0A7X8XV56_9BACT|nr:DUF1254 domain-containing protein [Flammeovirga agarivorans]NLR90993.1 DUF1254 domain-containing protein [Flammeovirga agarivorans]
MKISKSSHILLLVLLLLGVLVLASWKFKKDVVEMQQKEELFKEVYAFGFPIVLMDYTKRYFLNQFEDNAINTFHHYHRFPDWEFRNVVRPNVDTFYSMCWLDLSDEPVVVHIPASDHYFLMPTMDAFSNVFASPGTRTTGNKEQFIVYTGPNWEGELPKGMIHISSPTNSAWIHGRIMVKQSQKDKDEVIKFQKGITARPLSQWDNQDYTPKKEMVLYKADTYPIKAVEELNIEQFMNRLSMLLYQNKPLDSDSTMLSKLKEIGFQAGQNYDITKLSVKETIVFESVPKQMQSEWYSENNTCQKFPWLYSNSVIKKYKDKYSSSAYVAFTRLGMNQREDAIYAATRIDSRGKVLTSKRKYVLHFTKEQLPQVNAFWSLTCYNEKNFLVKNLINRYKVGSQDGLKFNEDGSLDIYIQSTKPEVGAESNWLPTPEKGRFSLILREYWPKDRVLENGNNLPKVTRRN